MNNVDYLIQYIYKTDNVFTLNKYMLGFVYGVFLSNNCLSIKISDKITIILTKKYSKHI